MRMPLRMPTEPAFDSTVERQIREAIERGEFSDLAGSGAPLTNSPVDGDPDWWARRLLRRERAVQEADELRRTLRAELPRLRVSKDREGASARVVELNEMIDALNTRLEPDQRLGMISL